MPFLTVNPPHIACISTPCALMKHMMLSQCHQLATPSSPLSLASPLLPHPLPPLPLIPLIPILMSRPSSPCSPCLKPLADIPRLLVCATSAHPSIPVKSSCHAHRAQHFAHQSSLGPHHHLEGCLLFMDTLDLVSLLFICFLCFLFVLDSRLPFLSRPYCPCHQTLSIAAPLDFTPTVALPFTIHFLLLI